MWGRYKPIVIVAGVIFLANIIVRILGLTVYRKSDNGQINSGLVFLAALAVIMLVAAYWWSVRFPSSRALPELGLVLLSATIACVLIGPVFSGALSRLHHPKVLRESVRRRRRPLFLRDLAPARHRHRSARSSAFSSRWRSVAITAPSS